MKLLIDADGCPVVYESVAAALDFSIEAVVVKNHAHRLEIPGATIVTVDLARDSADFHIVNRMSPGDVVITQDHGLSAMVLARGGLVMTQDGLRITPDNIDLILARRHFNQTMRRKHHRNTHSRRAARSEAENREFDRLLRILLKELTF